MLNIKIKYIMKKFVQLLWSEFQKFWDWLTGWDEYLKKDLALSQKSDNKPRQFYECLIIKQIILGFAVWMLTSLAVNSGPLFLLDVLMTACLVVVQRLCFKHSDENTFIDVSWTIFGISLFLAVIGLIVFVSAIISNF